MSQPTRYLLATCPYCRRVLKAYWGPKDERASHPRMFKHNQNKGTPCRGNNAHGEPLFEEAKKVRKRPL